MPSYCYIEDEAFQLALAFYYNILHMEDDVTLHSNMICNDDKNLLYLFASTSHLLVVQHEG